MSDYAKRVERLSTALTGAIVLPIYFVVAALVYDWNGWTGIAWLCGGAALYGVGYLLWFVWRARREAA
jgi:hypothetical protein